VLKILVKNKRKEDRSIQAYTSDSVVGSVLERTS